MIFILFNLHKIFINASIKTIHVPENNTDNQLLGAQSIHKVWRFSASHLSMDTKDYNHKI